MRLLQHSLSLVVNWEKPGSCHLGNHLVWLRPICQARSEVLLGIYVL
jgi:hypothetical protein